MGRWCGGGGGGVILLWVLLRRQGHSVSRLVPWDLQMSLSRASGTNGGTKSNTHSSLVIAWEPAQKGMKA